MAPKIVNKEAKKADILQAAMQVFSQNGIAKTKMADIAKVAGIGKGTIYEYFRSKEDIFGEAFQFFNQNTEKELQKAITSTDDPIEKLHLLFDVSLSEFIESSGDFAAIMMDFWAEGIRTKDEKIMNIINLEQIYTDFRQMIAGILDDGIRKGVFRVVDTQSLSAVLIAAMDGVMLQWIMDKNLLNLHQVANVMLDALINGIKK